MLRTLTTTTIRSARAARTFTTAAYPSGTGPVSQKGKKKSLTYMASLLGFGFGGTYAVLRMAFGRPPPPILRAVPEHPRVRRPTPL